MDEPKIIINQYFLKLISEIDEFKGAWTASNNLSSEYLHGLRKTAALESVGSSCRIAGARLNDLEIENILLKLTSKSTKSLDEQVVAGYAELIDIVLQTYEDFSLTENHIKQLHYTLLRRTDTDEHHRGEYKKLSNHIVAFNEKGKEIGIVLETAMPFDTARVMHDLLHWTVKSFTEQKMHPVLIIAVFIIEFLAIHPFQKGNGRLSRILTMILLLRTGYAYVPFSSLEKVIEENKDLYHRSLRRTQITLKSKHPDWEPWLTFLLNALKKQQSNLAANMMLKKLGVENKSKEKLLNDAALPTLSVCILKLLQHHERLTISEIVKTTAANQNTLKVRLKELVNSGRIQRYGKARATWYALENEE
ncbi:MAG: Fic family protein [Pseudomonadota bacterium]